MMQRKICKYLFNGIKRGNGKNIIWRCLSSQFRTETKSNTIQESFLPIQPYFQNKGQIFHEIKHTEFQERRLRLMNAIAYKAAKLEKSSSDHVIIIPSATKVYMSEKIPYIFHQNADFFYMTGFKEPDSILVLTSDSTKLLPLHKATMFVQNNDSHSVLWDGPKTGVEGAVELLGVDDALSTDQLYKFLDQFAKNKQNVVIWYNAINPVNMDVHKVVMKFLENSTNLHLEFPQLLLHQSRIIKSSSEIELMKRSCEIASDSFVEVIRMAKPKMSEHVLHARMEYECKIRGADYLAYPPVVAGGKRANIIHYINNDQCIDDGEMVLMDAGCSYNGYSSDITRTWPIGGKFSPAQRILYEVLLDIQVRLIKKCLATSSLNSLFAALCHMLGKRLQEIGIISPSIPPNDLFKIAQEFCPHHVGHYLGMDVHDTNLITRNITLQPGMIITIEPGIYINENNRKVPEKFRGLGLRIEDNILITDADPINLTIKCPKSIHDLETFASEV